MLRDEFKTRLMNEIAGEVLFEEPMGSHSTLKIGGPAEAFVTPTDRENLIKAIDLAREENIEYYVMGVGSNILFRDEGVDGLIINTSKLTNWTFDKGNGGCIVNAEAGVLINDMVNFGVSESFSGFEPLAGIPGSVGGAVYMNAGTHDGYIENVLLEVTAVDKSGKIWEWPKDRLEFSYRKTRFPRACTVLSAKFGLKEADRAVVEAKVMELRERRKQRHPLKWPSAGSVFKNPERSPSAGELIESAGLKGVRVGGARVANEHGNWIINENNATAKDVEILIQLVREKVNEHSELWLDPEIIVIGKKSEEK